MAIEYEVNDELFCPVIYCDECDCLIKDTPLSMVAWYERLNEEMEGKRFIPAYLHKGRCLQAFETRLSKGSILMTIELRHFLEYLSDNANIDGRKRRK